MFLTIATQDLVYTCIIPTRTQYTMSYTIDSHYATHLYMYISYIKHHTIHPFETQFDTQPLSLSNSKHFHPKYLPILS